MEAARVVEVVNRQTAVAVDQDRLRLAVETVLAGESIGRAIVSVAIVGDEEIHSLNRQHLQHDYATDVLSFLLEREGDWLEGEVVVSADTAAAEARKYESNVADELLLYVVHGALHLAGYDDQSPADRQTMRRKERRYLGQLGVVPRWRRA